MILSYRDARTERFAKGERIEPFRRKAERVLDRLDAAVSLTDIANFPGHRLEKLKGRPGRDVERPDQRAMAYLFSLDRRRPKEC